MVRKGYTCLILCTVSGVAAGLQKHGQSLGWISPARYRQSQGIAA
nr:hypothetical protein [Bifidobacterium catenulatum]